MDKDRRALPDKPLVSLLVACRNEEKYIGKCISSILAQDYPRELLEVIILDGMSEDRTREIIEEKISGVVNFRLLDNPKIIQSAAWNFGVEICQGDVISIVSGHVILSPDYVSKSVETLYRTGVDLVGGTVRSISDGAIGEAIAIAMSSPFGVGGARFRYTEREEEVDTVFMGFCTRDVYVQIGAYDEELVRNQDDEFSYRLTKSGRRILCNPEIKSHYYSRSTVKSLWKQYFQYGFWKVRVLQKHPGQMRLRQFIPPVFVLSLIGSMGIALLPGIRSLAALAPILYLVTNLIFSFQTAAKRDWKYFFMLPIVFATLHLSYGLGFIIGLFKFWNRWGDKVGRVPTFNSAVE